MKKQKSILFFSVTILIALAGCKINGSQVPEQVALSTPIPIANIEILPREERPNIIFILVDDLDEKLGTLAYMPVLEKELFAKGFSISDYFISDPVCCPARVTFLTGQYVHNHQVYMNAPPAGSFEKFYALGGEASTVPVWLQAAGYETYFLGKYMNRYPIPTDKTYVPPGWTGWVSPAKGKPYTGLNYTLNENGELFEYYEAPENYITDVLTQKTIGLIEESAGNESPFFIFLSYFAPHEPSYPAERHANLFLDLEVPRTLNFNEENVDDKPGGIRHDPLLDASQIAELDHLYRLRVQSMQAVDEGIQAIIDMLETTGQLENTYIIFTSDNGFHLGNHRMYIGKAHPYEEDINVPFIIRGPGVPIGEVLDGYLSTNVDFAATIADLAGVVPPTSVDGKSILPLLADETRPAIEDWRTAVLIEFYGHKSDVEGPLDAAWAGLRTARYVYIEYADGFIELYDLFTDPYQIDNLAYSSNPDPEMLATFSAWLHELMICEGEACSQLELVAP